MKEIYEPKFVETLFDKMLGIYTEAFGNSKMLFKFLKEIILKSNISIIFTVAPPE